MARQNEVLTAAVTRNNQLTSAMGALCRENHKLRKELDGYKRGKWWTIISSFLPTMRIDWEDDVKP